MIQLFQQYGDIVHHKMGSGNWLFMRFESPFQAERAAKGLVHISNTSVVGVQQMTSLLSKQLNVTITEEGWIQQPTLVNVSTSRDEMQPLVGEDALRRRKINAPSLPTEQSPSEGIYIRPKRRKSICERIVDYFWAY